MLDYALLTLSELDRTLITGVLKDDRIAARFWSAPVPWRFGKGGRFESGTGVTHSRTQACPKPGEPPIPPSKMSAHFSYADNFSPPPGKLLVRHYLYFFWGGLNAQTPLGFSI